MDNNIENTKEKKSKISSILKVCLIVIITAVITYFCTVTFTLKAYLNTPGITYMSTKMGLIKNKLQATYIYDMNEDKMIESAIKGYVQGINDPYTQYLPKEDMENLMESTTGNYVGIGVYMGNNTVKNKVMVLSVIEGSVAESAGIQAGDYIIKVDDVEYTGEQLEQLSNAVKGEEGTNVKITVLRGEEEKEFNILRSNVKVKTVGGTMIDDIGYIQIVSFNEGTAKEFKDCYNQLKSNNPKGLVIDLRNNGGGLVNESLEIAETMVEKGKTLLIMSDNKSKDKVEKSSADPIINIPVVLLINESTASASEILAGALKDNCNYKIIGTKSYGKGVIQNVFNFSDGTGLKVTVEEYFTPNRNVINKVGIIPDEEVLLDEEWQNIANIPYEYDLQLQAAVKSLK